MTLLLASITCKLSDILKLIREQEILVETLKAQRRSTTGAEFLLEIFKESAIAIATQRKALEAKVIRLSRASAPFARDGFGDEATKKEMGLCGQSH